jgi:hypothetical protein
MSTFLFDVPAVIEYGSSTAVIRCGKKPYSAVYAHDIGDIGFAELLNLIRHRNMQKESAVLINKPGCSKPAGV